MVRIKFDDNCDNYKGTKMPIWNYAMLLQIDDMISSPTPKRFPETRGKSRGLREIWRAKGMDFPIPPEFWWNGHSLIISREVLILTLSIFNALDVCIS